MGIVRAVPVLEDWLDAHAESWSILSDGEYKAVVRSWSEGFSLLVWDGAPSLQGDRAMHSLADRLPADVYLFSGLHIPRLANMGGCGPTGYRVDKLRNVRRDLANRSELILVSGDLAWSCVFSHEAGAFVNEHLYERASNS